MIEKNVENDIGKYRFERRIFTVINGKLKIGRKNYPKSHDVWLIEKNWIKSAEDPLYEKITRGMLNPQGDLYFYVGENLKLTKKSEKEFFEHLKELVERLNISGETKIYGGMIRGKNGTRWPGENGIKWDCKKDFGLVKNFI